MCFLDRSRSLLRLLRNLTLILLSNPATQASVSQLVSQMQRKGDAVLILRRIPAGVAPAQQATACRPLHGFVALLVSQEQSGDDGVGKRPPDLYRWASGWLSSQHKYSNPDMLPSMQQSLRRRSVTSVSCLSATLRCTSVRQLEGLVLDQAYACMHACMHGHPLALDVSLHEIALYFLATIQRVGSFSNTRQLLIQHRLQG